MGAWDPGTTGSWGQSVLSGVWPAVIKTGKGRQVPAGQGDKGDAYPMAVTGFLGKSSSRGGGVGTGPHVPRSAWEARQVAMAWLRMRGRP